MTTHMIRVDNDRTVCDDDPIDLILCGHAMTREWDYITCKDCIEYLDDGANDLTDSEYDEIIERRQAEHDEWLSSIGIGVYF